jgi:ectoine hydroxylase-related dioxygenase (phytanoyl-CoA dioxygenase family)
MPDFMAELETQGFCLVAGVAHGAQIQALKSALTERDLARAERDGQTYGARNLLHLVEVVAVAAGGKVAACLQPLLGHGFRLVRGLFFDKTPNANWPVTWHQDLSLAIQQRRDLPGWAKWTVKRGVVHVQPPAEILGRMVTMRLHLDDCPAENGPLRVVRGSHRHGVLTRDQIRARALEPAQTIIAGAGDALFMRPLLLHASSPAQAPSHRRVLHLEFAPSDLLPEELRWAGL